MTDSTDMALGRMRGMLADPSATFTRTQLVWFISAAMRMGHEHGHAMGLEQGDRAGRSAVAELILDALAHPSTRAPFSERELRMEGYRNTARREHDTAAAHPWRTDHPGGSVPVWGDE